MNETFRREGDNSRGYRRFLQLHRIARHSNAWRLHSAGSGPTTMPTPAEGTRHPAFSYTDRRAERVAALVDVTDRAIDGPEI